jgi:hypothetical protein
MTTPDWRPLTSKIAGKVSLGPFPQFSLLDPSRLLWYLNESHQLSQINKGLRHVYIIQVALGSDKKKKPLQLFAGPLNNLEFNANRWMWLDKQLLHSYIAKQGRHFLNPQKELECTMAKKWSNILTITFFPYWFEVKALILMRLASDVRKLHLKY